MFISIISIINIGFWSYFLWYFIKEPDFSIYNKEYRYGVLFCLAIITISLITLISKIVRKRKKIKAYNEYQLQQSVDIKTGIDNKKYSEERVNTIEDVTSQLQNRIVSNMTGIEYERYCGEKLKTIEEVVKIEYTPPSNDYGADIIVYLNDGKKVVVQCKRYNGKVNNTAVQEVVAALAHYNADAAFIMTNSVLTENARILAKENGVRVIDNFM